MRSGTLTRISLLLAVLASGAWAGDQYVVRTSSTKLAEVAARHGLKIIRALPVSARNLFVVELPKGASPKSLSSDPAVQSVEPDHRATLPENRPGAPWLATASALSGLGQPLPATLDGVTVLAAYVGQPGVSVIDLPAARTFATGAGTVAILDTGVDVNHPALKGALVPGYDFTRDIDGGSEMNDLDQSTSTILDSRQSTSTILDQSQVRVLNQSTTAILDQSTSTILDGSKLPGAFGHGTMVAGVVRLVAPTAKIMPVKVFEADGTTTISRIVAGIHWAVDHGANVINMSFSTTEDSKELRDAINYANSKRVICVASAGNEGERITVFPAGYGVIGVGSTNNQLVRSSFSNYGDKLVDLAAPGEGVITLYPGGHYAAAWGTSFSAPFVAGGAALLVQLAGNTNQSQAAQALDQAKFIGQELGAGELDLLAASLYRATHGR